MNVSGRVRIRVWLYGWMDGRMDVRYGWLQKTKKKMATRGKQKKNTDRRTHQGMMAIGQGEWVMFSQMLAGHPPQSPITRPVTVTLNGFCAKF